MKTFQFSWWLSWTKKSSCTTQLIQLSSLWIHFWLKSSNILLSLFLEFRLADGLNTCSGRVEVIYENFGWGTVLDNGWNVLGGDVICRQMGCGSALSVNGGSAFGKGLGTAWMYNTTCTGTEISLKSCISGYEKKSLHNNDAGVVCRGKCERQTVNYDDYAKTARQMQCDFIWIFLLSEVKLVNSQSVCHGTVQVRYSGDWGTICHYNWDLLDGIVLCRELGCGPLKEAYTSAYFGNGTGEIMMDNVLCTGSESSLKECSHSTSVNSLCTHSQDAGVDCGGKFKQKEVWNEQMYLYMNMLHMFATSNT